MAEAIIAIGSNVGDRGRNLENAVEALRALGKVTAISSVYETEPMYLEAQPWFLNAVVAIETDLEPMDLLSGLQSAEATLGRKRDIRFGPRTVDLDILFYDALVLSEPGLEIPHPRLAERMFVLAPLIEIRPDIVHPVLGVRVSELARALKSDKKAVRKTGALGVP
jgi:2-amino-4-hydroxy-6-hydroxymethyldihydropteridine diphosphokinase